MPLMRRGTPDADLLVELKKRSDRRKKLGYHSVSIHTADLERLIYMAKRMVAVRGTLPEQLRSFAEEIEQRIPLLGNVRNNNHRTNNNDRNGNNHKNNQPERR